MQFLLFSNEFSREGLMLMTDRYSSYERVVEYLDQREDDPGLAPPGGLVVVPDWYFWSVTDPTPTNTPTVTDALRLLGLGSDLDGEVFRMFDGDGFSIEKPAAFPSDLDEQGVCRCGCGYVDPARTPIIQLL